MNMLRKLFCWFLLGFPLWAGAISPVTGDSLNYLLPQDTVFLTIGPTEEKLFSHQIVRRQTIYSLAKFYGLEIEDLYAYNPDLRTRPVSVGESVKVPIPNRAIRRFKGPDFTPRAYVPVVYRVQHGDNLYRIARYYFKMPLDTLMIRNHLPNAQLHSGQKLQVGWISLGGVPDTLRSGADSPLARVNQDLRRVFYKDAGKQPKQTHQGPAYWLRSRSGAKTDLFALHRSAAINSVMSVTNPMTKRRVYVKVVGRIPDQAYTSEIIAVLSQSAAEALGAKDPKFFVSIEYFR